MRPRTADDGPPVNPERSRLPPTDRCPQSAVRLNQHPDRSLPERVRDMPRRYSGRTLPFPRSPTPPHSLSPTPVRFKETRLLPTRLQIVPATDRGGDRAALGRAGPGGPRFPSPPAQTVAIGGPSTDGAQKCAQVRLWHSSCGPKGLHMRTMHRATAETGFRCEQRSARKTVSAVRVLQIILLTRTA